MPQTVNHDTASLAKKPVIQLRQLCKEDGLKQCSKLRKAELVEKLTNMYAKRVISALITNKYKKSQKKVQKEPVERKKTCDICLEGKTCVKICECSSCICMACLEHVPYPEKC